ncbi:MAG: acyltransferase [Gammaproteobacteria bacterium]|nr:acyltransferase [Gammaproteobacteria bacterium]
MLQASVAVMHWRERPEGGNRTWLLIIRWMILHIGRSTAWFFMFPTALYFFLVRTDERRASKQWLQQVQAPLRGYPGVLRHIFTFAMTIVDRVLMLADRDAELDIQAVGLEQLNQSLQKGQGCLLLGSHLGSFEAIRALQRHAPSGNQIKVVMDRHQNSLITRVMEEINPDISNTVIDARQSGPIIVIEAAQALAEGAIVTMLADRIFRHEASAEVSFMQRPTRLPLAPLGMAAALDVDVFVVFGLYTGKGCYKVIFEPLPRPATRPGTRHEKRLQLQQWVAQYAQRLEYYARRYPYNWFNFYDYWNTDRDAVIDPGSYQQQ